MSKKDQPPITERLRYWQLAALQLVKQAEADGVVITIERKPLKPLAMRNHVAHIEAREKR